MTILICFHYGSFANFKHYYLFYVKEYLADLFSDQLSYNSFVELEAQLSVEMMLFLQVYCFGRCTGISFVESTCIPVCHNKRIRPNRVFRDYTVVTISRTLLRQNPQPNFSPYYIFQDSVSFSSFTRRAMAGFSSMILRTIFLSI